MWRRPIKEINAEFLAEEKYLDSIQRTARESCITAGLSKKDTTAVMLAIEEAATNVIRHAYLYEKGIVRLRIVIYKKLIVFSIIDFGRSFEPNQTGKLDLKHLVESGRKGGLGFYMIQKIMDSVEYISTAAFNELRMIKQLLPSSGGGLYLRRLMTLRVKFSLWTLIIMAILIGGSIYYFDYRTSEQMYNHKHETVTALGKTIADQAAGYYINRRSDVEFDQLIISYKRANPEIVQIVLTDELNLIRAHSDDILNIRKPFEPHQLVDTAQLYESQQMLINEEVLNYVIIPVTLGERSSGKVHLTYSTETIFEKLTDSRQRIFLLTLFMIGVGILGIYILSNYFVSPILKITNRIRRFTSGDMETELPLEGAEEFFEISRAFNEMITRLSQDRRNIVEREKMAKEIEVASEIQKTLLPEKLPQIAKLEIETFYRAASVIGGDLYDIFKISANRYCLVVADVSGKGVPASLVMSMLRTVIQIHAVNAVSPKMTLEKVNRYLQANIPPGMFVTLILAFYSEEDNTLQLVSAGHNPLLYFLASEKRIQQINPKGMPLGMPVKQGRSFIDTIEEKHIVLSPGDAFLMYTDGITEAHNRDNEQFGMDRLDKLFAQLMTEQAGQSVENITKYFMNEIDDFSGFAKSADDITFIMARQPLPEKSTDSSESSSTVDLRNLRSD